MGNDRAVGIEAIVSVVLILSLLSVLEGFVAVFVGARLSGSGSSWLGSTDEGDCLEIGGLEFCEYESFESR